jgi:hypothetical protein
MTGNVCLLWPGASVLYWIILARGEHVSTNASAQMFFPLQALIGNKQSFISKEWLPLPALAYFYLPWPALPGGLAQVCIALRRFAQGVIFFGLYRFVFSLFFSLSATPRGGVNPFISL